MSALTPMNWSARPLRRARLFKSLLRVCAALAVGYSCWPWLESQPFAQVLVVLVLALVCVREHTSYARSASVSHEAQYYLGRLAAGHWRVTMANQTIDGSLHHVWHGWGWITVRVRSFRNSDSQTITVWRSHVSEAHWHLLRVWTAWEVAMAVSPEVSP